MRKNLILALGMLVALLFASMSFAGPASATGGGNSDQPAENKPVTFCHATASDKNPYEKITTNLNAFLNAGHVDHSQGGRKDIYPEIRYTTKGGDVVTIPAQGDQSLLAFDDCNKPPVDEKIAKPVPSVVDKCGTEDDAFSVAPGDGYTVGDVQIDGLTRTIVVTLEDGFQWSNGSKDPLTFSHTFTDVDCDLPETGVDAKYNVLGGGLAGIALLGAAAMFVTAGRKKSSKV